MRCTSPRTVGFYSDGKTLCWSKKHYSKEFPPFQIPCGKCISCRLENARQTAVRCVHEAAMYDNNSFITLTYSDEHLVADKLYYVHFQQFVKDLRSRLFDDLLNSIYPFPGDRELKRKLWKEKTKQNREELYDKIRIGVYCAGEYGDKKKRPHWHACIFNWKPRDPEYKYTNDTGDEVFTSKVLTELWGRGNAEFGNVSFHSAGYVARYASKKLIHGKDGTHGYEPIARRSCKNAIGKKWIEKNWRDVFTHGTLSFDTGKEIIKCGIPRYYEKWLKKNKPDEYVRYVTQVKPKIMEEAQKKEEKITLEEKKADQKRSGLKGLAVKHNRARAKILEQKFNELQKYQKDI